MGDLVVSNPTKVYARRIKPFRNNSWSWRIYLPKGHRFRMPIATSNIPAQGLPPSRNGCIEHIETGMHVVDTSVEQSRDCKWLFYAKTHDGTCYDSVELEAPPVFDEFEIGGASSASQESSAIGAPLTLLRLRKINHKDCLKPEDGVMIWIEEAK
jgi:hypothetical protein